MHDATVECLQVRKRRNEAALNKCQRAEVHRNPAGESEDENAQVAQLLANSLRPAAQPQTEQQEANSTASLD
jgi:hypothetical protein